MANSVDVALRLIADTAGFNNGMDAAKSAATALAGALAAIGLGLSAKEIIDIADATQQMASRLKNATDSTIEYNEVQARLLKLANSTYRPLQEAQEVYLSTAMTMKSLGYNTEQILAVTESLSLSFTHNATRADQAQSAQDALSKAMAKGAVDADAWMSIITGADNIVGDLAKSTGRTEAEIRSLGASGAISINELTNALIQSRDRNQELADAMSTSTADGIQSLKNNVTALIGSLNEQYDITGRLSSLLVGMGENLDWLGVLFEDAIAAIDEFAAGFDGIDTSIIDALKQSLSVAYDLFKQMVGVAFDLGKTVFEVFGEAFKSLGILVGGVDEAGNSFNGLTLIIQALNIGFGFVTDGIYAVRIGINLLSGAFYAFGSSAASIMSTITAAFPELSARFAAQAEQLKEASKKNFSEAEQLAINFESQGLKRIKEVSRTKEEVNQQELADAKAKFDELNKLEDVSAEKKLQAAQEWAEAAIKASNGVLDEQLKNELAAKGFAVAMDEAGDVAVTALAKVEVAAAETDASIKRNAEEAAKVLKIDLYQAINGISEGFNNSSKSLDTFIKGMTQLGITGQRAGEVTYQAWLEWLKTAKNQQEVDVATFKLQEFGKTGQLSTQQVEMGMQAIRQVVQKLPADLDPVEQAFERLGIKTKEQLKLAAQSAMADFNTIAASGKGTAEDVEKAYQRVIQAAIASGDESVVSQAKAQAAMGGLTVEINKAGKAVTQTFEEFAFGSDKAVRATDRVSTGYHNVANAGVAAAQSIQSAWDNTITSLSLAAEKLDALTRKQGAATGQDFLNGKSTGSDMTKGLNQTGLMAYNEQQIRDKLLAIGYDDKRAALKAKELYGNGKNGYAQSSFFGGSDVPGALRTDLTNFNFINDQIEQLSQNLTANMGGGNSKQAEKTVNVNLQLGGQTVNANVPANQEQAFLDMLKQGKRVSG